MTHDINTHHTWDQSPKWLFDRSKELAPRLRDNLPPDHLPMFIYRGLSGVACATALSIAYYSLTQTEPGMVYVRRPGEANQCHSRAYFETSYQDQRRYVLVFVDDFICSGLTRDKCVWVLRDALAGKFDHIFTHRPRTQHLAERLKPNLMLHVGLRDLVVCPTQVTARLGDDTFLFPIPN